MEVRERAFLGWGMQCKSSGTAVPGGSGRSLESVVVAGPSLSVYLWLENRAGWSRRDTLLWTGIAVAWHCFCHTQICGLYLRCALRALDTVSTCFPVRQIQQHACTTWKLQAVKLSCFSCLLTKYLLKWYLAWDKGGGGNNCWTTQALPVIINGAKLCADPPRDVLCLH